MAISTQKLLGSTNKGGAIVLSNKSNSSSSSSFIVKKSPLVAKQKKIKLRISKSKESFNYDKLIPDLKAIDKSVKFIDKTFKKIIDTNSKILSEKDKQSKLTKRKTREDDLEKQTKKEEKDGKGSGISIPKPSFLDKILNFFFWTIAGNLLFKFLTPENIDKAKSVINTITSVAKFIGDIFVKTVEGLVNFIDFSYEKFDQIRGFIKKVGGEGALKVFDQFSGMLNKVINGAIILAILLSKSKGFGGGRGGRGGRSGDVGITGRRAGRTRAVDPAAARRYAERYGRDAAIKKFGKDGVRSLGGKYGRSAGTNIARKGAVALLGKGGTKAVLKFVKPFLKRLPLIGGLIDFGLSVAMGEPLGRAAFKAIGATVLGAIGTGFGGPIGAILGGFAGDWAGGKLYDIFFGNKKNDAGTQGKYYGGMITAHANGGNIIGQGGRTLKKDTDESEKLQKRKYVKPPQKVEVGKDVGGINEVKKLFPQSSDNKKKSPFDALLSLSYTLKKIPFIGRIMGAAIDLALGQSITTGFFKDVSDSLVNLYQILKGSNTIGDLHTDVNRDIARMEDGGEIKSVTAGRFLRIDQNKGVTTEEMRDAIENSLRQSTSRDITKAVNVIRRQLGLKEIGDGPRPRDNPNAPSESPDGGGVTSLGTGGGSLKDMTAQDWSDLAYIVSAEAARGTDDEYGVAAAILNRVASPAWPNTIMGVGTQANQFEAVYKGMAKRDPALAKKLEQNQSKIVDALKKLNGRDSFKGQSMLSYKGSDDVMFDPRGNFFHYRQQQNKSDPAPANPDQNWKKLIGPSTGGSFSSGGTGGAGGAGGGGGGAGGGGTGGGSYTQLSNNPDAKRGSKLAGELGRFLDKKGVGGWGSGVHQHPEHPPWSPESGHSPGSLHYASKGARAIDVGGYGRSRGYSDQDQILAAVAEFNKMKGVKPVQLLKDGYPGHSDHVHIAYQGGGPIQTPTKDPTKYNSLQKYQSYGGGSSVLAVKTVYIKT